MRSPEKTYWLDEPRNVRTIYLGLALFGLAWLLADFFLDKHEDVGFAGWFGFYALYGFIGCVVLVLTAKALRVVLMRREDYYDR